MSIKKSITFLIFILFFGFFGSVFIHASENEDVTLEKIAAEIDLNDDFADDTVIIVLRKKYSTINKMPDLCIFEDISYSEIIDLSHIDNEKLLKNKNDFEQVLEIKLKNHSKSEVINVINLLSRHECIKYAGPNRYLQLDNEPNDPLYPITHVSGGQWAHSVIQSENAWDYTVGNHSVRVGIIDTGVSSHPDLNANVTTGLDFVNMNGDNPGALRDDPSGHGTHVAGILGAVGNQSTPTGIAGVNWNVTIVPMQVANAGGAIDADACVRAVYYAINQWNTNNRISVLSMSIGGYSVWPEMESAIRLYQGLFVCSTGNRYQNNDLDGRHHYPSFYASDLYSNPILNMITVGRTDINDAHPSGANWGAHSILIYAPGQNIISTVPLSLCNASGSGCTTSGNHIGHGYHSKSGSSMSTPHVSGVAALLLSINGNLTTQQLKNSILNGADTITIQVPNDETSVLENQYVKRLNSYKAVKYVLDNYTINLNCATTNHSLINNCPENDSIIYKINVKCPKSYKFISSASSPLDMTFYDSNFNEISTITPVMTNNNCTGTITTYLNPGTYYLRVNYVNATDSGNITTSYQATWPVTLNATFNTNLNILSNLHLTGNNDYHCVVSFNNTYGEKLFKFKLDAGNNATYPEGAIKVYTDSTLTNPLDRYSVNGITYPATSNALENELYVFLPEEGTYYIEITLPRNDYVSLQFLVSDVDEMSINYLNTLAISTLINVFSYKTEASYFKKVDISHKSKIKIELNSNTGCFNSTKLFIFKLNKDPGYDIGVNHYSLSSILQVNLTFDEDSYNTTLILDEGTYYIGYTNNINCSLNLNLRRLINTNVNMDGTLVADPMPNQGYTIGSEVLLNNGSYNNYSITEGFTRCIYLMNGNTLLEPSSRLLYDWYSSDDDVALVTQYGTVLAKSVTSNTNVTIYAILKEDPSVVYRKTFTILNDTLTYSNAPINIYTSMTIGAGVYTPIDLSDEVVPINILQYYSWSISQGGSVDYWGNIYATTTSLGDTLYITGNYIYNSRVKVFVDAFVTLPMSGYELDYNPLLWDDEVEDNNNCYNYAINSQVWPGTNTLWIKQQPGQYSESMTYDYSDYDAMYTAVHNDFVKYNQIYNTNLIFTPIDKFAKCPEGTYKVALVACSDDWDYHWYRQDSDGYWSHKPGTDFVRRYDDSYDLIIDPSNCDWGDYDTFLGFFAVSPWNTMYTEPENMRTLGEANPSISLVDLDDIGDLEIGMSYYEVVQTLGSAGLDIGSGTLIQQYETTSNNIVLINYHLVNGEYVVASIDVE